MSLGWPLSMVGKNPRRAPQLLLLGLHDIYVAQWKNRKLHERKVGDADFGPAECDLLLNKPRIVQTPLRRSGGDETHSRFSWSNLISSNACNPGTLGTSCREKHHDVVVVFGNITGHRCKYILECQSSLLEYR